MGIGDILLYGVFIFSGAGITVAWLRIQYKAGLLLLEDGDNGNDTEPDAVAAKTPKAVIYVLNWLIEFYLSLIAYLVLHMLIVTSSNFVESFNIPPLNIGIYVDKLAAIRALLMVLADILEYGILDEALDGSNNGLMQKPLIGKDAQAWNPRRIGSILSFIVMLSCRIVYLWLIYESDNKSLSVFITLCIEGFWFGVFQMSFFAIGPEYNAVTSLGIHTMGNFIFFGQLLMQRKAQFKPEMNCLYRVRVNAKICLVTSVSAFFVWFGFCLGAAGTEDAGSLAKYYKIGQSEEINKLINKDIELSTALNAVKTEIETKKNTIGSNKSKLPEVQSALEKVEGAIGALASAIASALTNSLTEVESKIEALEGAVKKAIEENSAQATTAVPVVKDALNAVKERVGKAKDAIGAAKVRDFNDNVSGKAVWSPFWLFIVGAFAEDFAVPGILPFAFLDPDNAALVNYLTPLFFMTGALVTVLLNDVFTGDKLGFKIGGGWMDWGFKKWSVWWFGIQGASSGGADVDQGKWWNFLWAMNVPKYIAFFISMWCIHGTYGRLRCIVQCRWRVLLLTMTVVIPRALPDTRVIVHILSTPSISLGNPCPRQHRL